MVKPYRPAQSPALRDLHAAGLVGSVLYIIFNLAHIGLWIVNTTPLFQAVSVNLMTVLSAGMCIVYYRLNKALRLAEKPRSGTRFLFVGYGILSVSYIFWSIVVWAVWYQG